MMTVPSLIKFTFKTKCFYSHSDNHRDAVNVSTQVDQQVPIINQQQSNEPAETEARLNMFTKFT